MCLIFSRPPFRSGWHDATRAGSGPFRRAGSATGPLSLLEIRVDLGCARARTPRRSAHDTPASSHDTACAGPRVCAVRTPRFAQRLDHAILRRGRGKSGLRSGRAAVRPSRSPPIGGPKNRRKSPRPATGRSRIRTREPPERAQSRFPGCRARTALCTARGTTALAGRREAPVGEREKRRLSCASGRPQATDRRAESGASIPLYPDACPGIGPQHSQSMRGVGAALARPRFSVPAGPPVTGAGDESNGGRLCLVLRLRHNEYATTCGRVPRGDWSRNSCLVQGGRPPKHNSCGLAASLGVGI